MAMPVNAAPACECSNTSAAPGGLVRSVLGRFSEGVEGLVVMRRLWGLGRFMHTALC